MPLLNLDRLGFFHLSLLLLAIPMQFFISKYILVSDAEKSYTLRSLVTNVVGFRNRYLTWSSWRKWCQIIISKFKVKIEAYSSPPSSPASDLPDPSVNDGNTAAAGGAAESTGKIDDPYSDAESPSIEVMKYRSKEGFFAESNIPRDPRPPHIMYRVGQVVRHKIHGYRGVIIGWDETARAPERWLKMMHPPDKKHWLTQPNYAILVDTRDRLAPQISYAPEENIAGVLVNQRIFHPLVDDFFESFEASRYIPRPYLRSIYPYD